MVDFIQQSVFDDTASIKTASIDVKLSARLLALSLVSIPPGKYLFSFRTQKSSLVGAIILR